MDKYALIKRFHHSLRLQFYMYAFMYIDPKTMTVEEYLPDTKIIVEDQSQNIGLYL